MPQGPQRDTAVFTADHHRHIYTIVDQSLSPFPFTAVVFFLCVETAAVSWRRKRITDIIELSIVSRTAHLDLIIDDLSSEPRNGVFD